MSTATRHLLTRSHRALPTTRSTSIKDFLTNTRRTPIPYRYKTQSVPAFIFSYFRYQYHSVSAFPVFSTVPVPIGSKPKKWYSLYGFTHFRSRYFSVRSETRVTTLPNGLRVATESNKLSHTATVCVWVDTGSRFETKETNGVAHFVEHMVFQGTSKRSSDDLMEEIENLGGDLSGYTSREHTVYVANVMAEAVCNVVDIMSDMLQNSTFNEDLIKDERNEILTELFEVMAEADEVIFDRLQAAAFQHSPLGRTVLGPPRNIIDMTKNVLQDYLSTHYTPHRMVISASGAVNHDDIVKQVNNMFTKLSTNPVTSTQLVETEPAIFTGSEIRKREDDTPFAHFGVVFKGASWTDPDSIALLVIQTMLGSWNKVTDVGKHKGSQLAQIVGIDEIAESVMAVNSHYKETGLFGFYAVGKPDCLDDLASVTMHEISKLCYRVTKEDVIRAQNQLKYSFCNEHPTAVEIGRQLLAYRRRIPLAELFARIDAVDVATVKRVANRFLLDKDIAIATSGPVKLLPDYNWFRRRTSMLCY